MLKKLLAVVVVALATTPAIASNENPFLGATIDLTWGNGQTTTIADIGANADGSPTFNVPDDNAMNPGNWLMEWTDVFFDADPFIAGNFAVTNMQPTDQTFTLTVNMATAFNTGGSTTIDGGTAITISDANGSGSATMSTDGSNPIYSAEINGGIVARTLFDDPYSLSPAPLPFAVTADFDNYFGEVGPAVGFLSEVSIVHTFTVSPGDKATVNSTFNIVPEPATLSLLAFGSIALVRRRR